MEQVVLVAEVLVQFTIHLVVQMVVMELLIQDQVVVEQPTKIPQQPVVQVVPAL